MEEEGRRQPKAEKKVVEHHHRSTSFLVGRIVEKGFGAPIPTSSSSPPPPSVLPFPVARHRSHGPHWVRANFVKDADEDKVEEEKDETDYDPVARFAQPVKRKEKNSLDFSRWRELVAEEPKKAIFSTMECSQGKTVESRVQEAAGASTGKKKIQNLYVSEVQGSEEIGEGNIREGIDEDVSRSSMKISLGEEAEVNSSVPPTLEITHAGRNVRHKSSLTSELTEPGNHSFVDDIDAENSACLQQMSQDEIAEAQSEIKKKMDPAILEMLKKRGRDKMDSKQGLKTSKSDNNSKVVMKTSGSVSALSSTILPASHGSEVWKAWSERVEKARELRFSLDGSIVEESFFQHPDADVQYNVGNVAERDFLRTEGDPASAGYTVKEAVALTRSMVPGQRAFALQLLGSVLDKALNNLLRQDIKENIRCEIHASNSVDWQAVWAYALGPEPELVLSLRIALDDNHNSVILACTKVIECLLSCHLNENFFNISAKLPIHEKNLCTAPVFRAKPEAAYGFLHGGFWKYNTKPSNIFPSHEIDENDDDEAKHTIQDDVVVAGQDVATGLLRMGVLPRICYLLEMDPLPSLEESLLSVLIGLARHSPACADIIVKLPRLVQTVVDRYTKSTTLGCHPYQTKSVILLKVLCEFDKQNCNNFVSCGFFRQIMWQFYRPAVSLDQWIGSSREHCKLTSSLMVQQLRLWRVCIQYGYCIEYFADFFPAICFWLSPPAFEVLLEKNIFCEFASVAIECYLVFDALSRRLPILHSLEQLDAQAKVLPNVDLEMWSWSHVVPMIDLGIKWLKLKSEPLVSFMNDGLHLVNHTSEKVLSHLLSLVSAVLHMFSTVIGRISTEGDRCLGRKIGHMPWLPYFVPLVGLEIVKNGILNFLDRTGMQQVGRITSDHSFADNLCHWRHLNDVETSLASSSCLHGLVRLIMCIDRCISQAKASNNCQHMEGFDSSTEAKILEGGLAKSAWSNLSKLQSKFAEPNMLAWGDMQFVECFGRGGPAPGVGLGWGSSGGGFWSTTVLLAQADAQLILSLHEISPIVADEDLVPLLPPSANIDRSLDHGFPILQKLNSVLGWCLVAGPEDKLTLSKAFALLLQVPVLKFLDVCMRQFILQKGRLLFSSQFMEDDYVMFGKALNAHFRNHWLSIKKSARDVDRSKTASKSSGKKEILETIHEESDEPEMSSNQKENLTVQTEWAHQRLPLPLHWFLSPITTVGELEAAHCLRGSRKMDNVNICSSNDVSEVVKSGLFFLLGLEAMSYFLHSKSVDSPVPMVSLVWKLHGLTMALLVKMEVLEEINVRGIFEALQSLYGELLAQSQGSDISCTKEVLDFQTVVHESYNTFVETFVEHFASVSYGDVIYGRQVAVYLHCSVGVTVRRAAWNALSSSHVLGLLPPMEDCLGGPAGYLEPVEDDDGILEAYAKSWVSGALDKAAARGSMSFMLVQHHLSSFIFHCHTPDKLILRNKLAKSLLRGLSRNQNQEGMLLRFINYSGSPEHRLDSSEKERRFMILSEACEGNSSLLVEVEKLKPVRQ